MKKQLFTLLTLLVLCVTGAWGDDVYEYYYNGSSTVNTSNYFSGNDMSSQYKNANNEVQSVTFNNNAGSSITSNKFAKLESSKYVSFTTTRTSTITVIAITKSSTSNNGVKLDGSTLGANAPTTTYTSYTNIFENVSAGTHSIQRNGTENAVVYVKVVEQGELTTPIITVDPTSVSINATESGTEVTEDISVTGANLTGSTLTATLNPSVTGLNVTLVSGTITNGSISTTATIHYTQTENANGSTTLTLSDGTTSKNVTVNYNAKVVAYTQKDVTKATTWDFSNTGATTSEIELTGDQNRVDILAANVNGYNIYDGFDSESLVVNGDRFLYNSNCCQVSAIKFHTNVPGIVDVTFSNTGGSSNSPRDPRYLTINGVKQSANTTTTTKVEGKGYAVPKGDVTIGCLLNDASTFIRVYEVAFTPATTASATITDAGWATLYTPWPLNFANATPAGLTAYIATLSNNTVTLTPVDDVPAGTGVVLKGDANTYSIPVNASSTNEQKGDMKGDANVGTALAENSAYILGINNSGNAQFFINSAGTIAAGKAYLPVGTNLAKALTVVFADDVTGISNVNAEEAAQPVKRIVKGQLVIEKNGKRYNAAGAEF